VGIFLAEIVAMIIIYLLPTLSYPARTLIDAVIMTALIFPVIYVLTFRRLLIQLENEREAAAALGQAYGRLRDLESIVDQSPAVAILWRATAGWPVEFASHNIKQFGYSAEELVGRRTNYLDLIDPEDRERVAAEVARFMVEGNPSFGQQYRIVTKSGDIRWLDDRTWMRRGATGAVTHFEGVLLDITERKEAEDKVRQERQKLKSILDAMQDGVYIVNEAYELEYVNPVIEKEFGALTGRKCYEYLHEREEPCPWCMHAEVVQGKPRSREWYSPKTGKIYELLDTPLLDVDGRVSMLKNLRDITQRKQQEEQLEEANQQLRQIALVEQEQRQLADGLREASAALGRSLDLDVVVETSLDYFCRLVPFDGAEVVLLGSDDEIVIRAKRGDWPWSATEHLGGGSFDVDDFPDLVELVQSGKSLLVPDVRAHPRWLPIKGEVEALSLLVVPLVAAGKAIGLYSLHKNSTDFFTPEHVQLAEALASLAAVAVQNAWLFEQVREGSERLQTLSRRLVEIQESERLYIARELHDEAGQALTSLVVMLRLVGQDADQPERVRAHVAEMNRSLQGVIEDLHRLAMALRPAALDHLGLEAAVRQNAEMAAERYGLAIRVAPFALETRLPRNVETILYRIVQEALNNIVRHAGASRVDIVLQTRDDKVIVMIEDNGVGFIPAQTKESEHIGLLGMRERAESVGGSLTVESRPGRGTTIVAEVPYDHSRSGRG
jgi:PAS domain S-box-containing protein